MELFSDYDFDLPEELIARDPVSPRDHSKLLVMNRQRHAVEHQHFYDLPAHLRAGDVMVINRTKSKPTALYGRCNGHSSLVIVLLKRESNRRWQAFTKQAGLLREGDWITFGDDQLRAQIRDIRESGDLTLDLDHEGVVEDVIVQLRRIPLPPYVCNKEQVQERTQPVYAKKGASVAASTAGLHFTEALLQRIVDMGVEIAEVYLEIGVGTFKPILDDDISAFEMHEEEYAIPGPTAAMVNAARAEGRRVVAVGTTALRALESAAGSDGRLAPVAASTRALIKPGYHFKIVDALVTNLHPPRSTLMLLVSAFAGKRFLLDSYAEAIDNGYRFLWFGDASFIVRHGEAALPRCG